jgi:hypothetical protein
MKKKFCFLALSLLLFLTSVNTSVLASGADVASEYNGTTVISTTDNSTHYISTNNPRLRIPNIWSIEATVSGQHDAITISAHNIGIDTIDKISCNVKITDKRGITQYHKTITFTGIKPFISQPYKMTIRDWKIIVISNIQAWDGKDYATRPSHTIKRTN